MKKQEYLPVIYPYHKVGIVYESRVFCEFMVCNDVLHKFLCKVTIIHLVRDYMNKHPHELITILPSHSDNRIKKILQNKKTQQLSFLWESTTNGRCLWWFFFSWTRKKTLLFYCPSSTTLPTVVKNQNQKPNKQTKTGERDKLGTLRQIDHRCEREGDMKARVHTHSTP